MPQDSWFRAAKLVGDGYGIGGGANTWEDQSVEDKESNFRALWQTLTWLAATGHEWHVERPDGFQMPTITEDWLKQEHDNWCSFKRHHGWVGAPVRDNSLLENELLYPWDELSAPGGPAAALATARAQTRASLEANLQALEALGYYPVKT